MNAKTVVLNGERMNYDNRLDYSILSDEVKVYEQTEPSQILERIQGFDIVVTKEKCRFPAILSASFRIR